jgi:alcohol dehydrogenase/L-iditol 2-dehydrogenase
MKALVKYDQGPDKVEIREVPEPRVVPGRVLVEVKFCGVCGWDVEMWRHTMANPVTVPVIQGHEFCGTIAEIGAGVAAWKVGDRVVSETSAEICGRCRCCRQGQYQLCPSRKGFGYGVDGAFTRYVLARQEILHRLPAEVSFEEGALCEPFCVVHHAVADESGLMPGKTALVIGPGPIGLISLQMARVLGAKRLILVCVDVSAGRAAFAGKHGWTDAVVNASRPEATRQIMDLTGGEGADVVIDAAGNAAALRMALDAVGRLGRIIKIGWGPEPVGFSLDPLLRKSATLSGTFGHNRADWEAVLNLMAQRRVDPRSLISGVLPLSRWREAFERMHRSEAIKMLLYPEAG